MSLGRLVFYLCNYSYFSQLQYPELAQAFLIGLRFDTSAIFIYLSLFFVLAFLPIVHRNKSAGRIHLILFSGILGFMTLLNLIDSGYYQFAYARSTFGLFKFLLISDDVAHFGPHLLLDFWYLFATWFGMLWLIIRISKRAQITHLPAFQNWKNYVAWALCFVLFSGLLVVGVRGGFQYQPLILMDAGSQRIAPLSLNTPYTVMWTVEKQELKDPAYFSPSVARNYFSALHAGQAESAGKPLNVVVIVVESLSKEFVGYLNPPVTYTPFLDSLCEHSLVFTRAFANGRRSIEGVPAILSSLPTMLDKAVIISNYSGNRFTSLANLLGEKGYTSAFFHGARNGSMAFDSYCKKVGFQYYFGLNQYPNQSDFDGSWGIFDEPYLQYVNTKLSGFKQPFFGTVFTLSSHHPYALPKGYESLFPEGTMPIHKTVRYTDFALKQFFKSARKTDWFANTLFVITADHATTSDHPYFQNRIGSLSIPVIFYSEALKLQGKNATVISQTDIMPSILSLLDYNQPYVAFGQSAFDTSSAHFSVSKNDHFYQIIEGEYVLQFNGEETVGFYHVKLDSMLTKDIQPEKRVEQKVLENHLKAYIQEYNRRLIQNTTEWNPGLEKNQP